MMFAVSMTRTEAAARRVLAEKAERKRQDQRKAFIAEAQRIAHERAAELERDAKARASYASIIAEYRCVYETGNTENVIEIVKADEIIKCAAKMHGVSVEDIKGPRRYRDYMVARHDAYAAVVYLKPNLSFPVIGRLMGGKDHTTILHGIYNRGYRPGNGFMGGFPAFVNAELAMRVREWALMQQYTGTS